MLERAPRRRPAARRLRTASGGSRGAELHRFDRALDVPCAVIITICGRSASRRRRRRARGSDRGRSCSGIRLSTTSRSNGRSLEHALRFARADASMTSWPSSAAPAPAPANLLLVVDEQEVPRATVSCPLPPLSSARPAAPATANRSDLRALPQAGLNTIDPPVLDDVFRDGEPRPDRFAWS